MSKKKCECKLSNIDMRDLYLEMMCYGDDWPSVLVLDELEDGSNIMRKVMDTGNELIYLKNADDMFEVLQNELLANKVKAVPADPIECHDLKNKDIMKWISCVVELADLLHIRCPQVIFFRCEDAGMAEENVMIIPAVAPYGKGNVIKNFVCIAHELRHSWQHKNCPEIFKNYVHVENPDDAEQMAAYCLHPSELDAEAYARKLANIVFGVDLLKDDEKLSEYAKNVDVDIDEDEIEYFDELFELDDFDYEEVDNTVEKISILNMAEFYRELKRIKFADNMEEQLDKAIEYYEFKLDVLGIDKDKL